MMLRRIAVMGSAVLAFTVPAVAQSSNNPTNSHVRQYLHAYYAVQHKFGHRTPGRQIVRWGFAPGKPATDAQIVTSLAVLNRMLNPPPVVSAPSVQAAPATSTTPTYSSTNASGGLADVPGVPASFAACVAQRESSDGTASSNVYGIIARDPGSSIAQQKATFSQMYQQSGTAPWAPYDGC